MQMIKLKDQRFRKDRVLGYAFDEEKRYIAIGIDNQDVLILDNCNQSDFDLLDAHFEDSQLNTNLLIEVKRLNATLIKLKSQMAYIRTHVIWCEGCDYPEGDCRCTEAKETK